MGNREPMPGMVEKRGHTLWLTHVLMMLGVTGRAKRQVYE